MGDLVRIFGGTIVDVGQEALTVMLAAQPAVLDDFEELLETIRDHRDPAHRPGGVAQIGAPPVRRGRAATGAATRSSDVVQGRLRPYSETQDGQRNER